MKTTIALAAQTIVIAASFAFAGWLEWLALRGLMRLMPARGIRIAASARPGGRAGELLRASSPGLRI